MGSELRSFLPWPGGSVGQSITKRFQVQSPVGAHMGGNGSLSLSLSLLPLPSPSPKINKHILRRGVKKEKKIVVSGRVFDFECCINLLRLL